MTEIVAKGLRDGQADTISATVDAAEIERRRKAVEDRRKADAAIISSLEFFKRFTDVEHAAIWAAAATTPEIGVGLTQGLAAGKIDLTGTATKAWLDALVTAGVLTTDRETAILTP